MIFSIINKYHRQSSDSLLRQIPFVNTRESWDRVLPNGSATREFDRIPCKVQKGTALRDRTNAKPRKQKIVNPTQD